MSEAGTASRCDHAFEPQGCNHARVVELADALDLGLVRGVSGVIGTTVFSSVPVILITPGESPKHPKKLANPSQ